MFKNAIICFSLLIFCSGCATQILNDLTDEKAIPTKLEGLYFDDKNLYVKYSAKLSVFNTHEKVGSLTKSELWNCAQEPTQNSGVPLTVQHKNVTYNLFEYNRELESCKPYWSRSKISQIDMSALTSLPIKKVDTIEQNDPSFSDKPRPFYAFSIKLEEQDEEKIYVLLVDRKLNKVLLMRGLKLPESYIKYQSKTGEIVNAVGSIPALAFDVITMPIQFSILLLLWN